MNLETVRDKRKADAPGKTSINRDVPLTRLIAGVSVPDKPLITAVIEYAQRLCEPYLFNHAMRSWLFAETIGRSSNKGADLNYGPRGPQHREQVPASHRAVATVRCL